MAAANPTVKLETLRELIAAGSVRSATLLGQRGGYTVLVSVGTQERVLANRAGSARLYARLDTAAKDLHAWGLAEFDVNVANYQPGRLRPARPDRAAQMKQAHEAAVHDGWFRQKVRSTLERLDRGEESLLDHDATFAELRTYAAKLDAPQPTPAKG